MQVLLQWNALVSSAISRPLGDRVMLHAEVRKYRCYNVTLGLQIIKKSFAVIVAIEISQNTSIWKVIEWLHYNATMKL